MNLKTTNKVFIRQRKELAEFFGFETRNKYEILDENKLPIGFCAEQNKGILGFLFRQLLGHWRSFELHFFNLQRQEEFKTHHPFRFFFQEFTVTDIHGKYIGRVFQRFGVLTKKFDISDVTGRTIYEMRSGFFRIWSFPIKDIHTGQRKAFIQKKWSGLLQEVFLDSDRFVIDFEDQNIPKDHRSLILAAAIFTDLQYFERKAKS